MSSNPDRKSDDVETPDAVGIRRARQVLGDLVNRAKYGNERIVLLRRGSEDAAIIGPRDLARLRALDAA